MQIPIMYELSGKKVLIIGGGKTAYRIMRRIKAFYGSITCVSKAFEPKILDMKSIQCIEEIMRHHAINEKHFLNVHMVIVTTNNTILNEKIYKYCQEKNLLCMTTHKNGPKDFDFMESEEKNGLLLAASTHGANPAFSSEMINRFMESIDEESFTRLEMMIEEKNLMRSLTKK